MANLRQHSNDYCSYVKHLRVKYLVVVLFCIQQQCSCHVGTMPTSTSSPNQQRDARFFDKPVVYTRLGTVRGIRKTVLESNVEAFLGIPYAKPPTGKLRFQKPVKLVDPWIDLYDANKMPNCCEQPILDIFPGFRGETQWNPNTEISEDCLYLNVWVPEWDRDSKQNPKMDVMVWIYGGAFTSGSISLDVYDGTYLAAANKVIVISMNYRTGAFGFLYLGTPDAPGNVGLYDQALALQWIKDNIEVFGGNPNSVTLFGESAGSASVSAHILSPLTRHLFQHAILQSGTLNTEWGFKQPEKSLQMAYKLSDLVGCSSDTVKTKKDVVKCLRDIPASAIIEAQQKLYKPVLRTAFVTTIDGELLPDAPLELIRKGNFKNTSMFMGTVANEGSYFALYDFLDVFDKDMPSLLTRNQASLIINTTFDKKSPMEKELIHFMYSDWKHPWDGTQNRDKMAMLIGDHFFTCPAAAFAQLLASKEAEIFYYLFNHRTSINPWGKWMGVLHGDEIDYIFGQPLNRKNGYTQEEARLSTKVMKHFVAFAKTGNPSTKEIDWPLYTISHPMYVELDTKNYKTGIGPRSTQCAFWNNLFPKIRNELSSSCKLRVSSGKVTNDRISGISLIITVLLLTSFYEKLF